MWSLLPHDEFKKRHRKLSKRHWREIEAVEANLQRYLHSLQQGTPPKQIQAGWVHPEPMDIVALDQRGGGKKQGGANKGKGLLETRLYVYPEVETETLHVITVGLKDTQSDDIEYCKAYVGAVRTGTHGGA